MTTLPSAARPRPSRRRRAGARLASVAAALALGVGALTAAPAQAADDVTIHLLDVNDFHGRIDANTVKVAGTIEQLRAEGGEDETLFLSAGDNIGASLFASSTQQDEPTIDVMNALDLAVSALGNHELDRGYADLVGRVADRADFDHLGANVRLRSTGEPALPAHETFEVGGLDVAVIGAVTEETPALVSPAGIADLEFTDPVEAVNEAVAELEASDDAPDVIVAAFHEGAGAGIPDGSTLEEELAEGGAFADIVQQTDAEVDAIFTGHTHKQYAWDAPVPGEPGRTRPILQTGSYGENIGRISLTVDGDTGEVTTYAAENVARTGVADADLAATYPRVAEVRTIVDEALAYADEIGRQPVAEITGDITTAYAGGTRDDRAGESTLGNLVSDAALASVAATPAGADLAVVNPGGLRADLLFEGTGGTDGDGVVTFAEANAVLPFANNLSSVTLTGASLKKVFEQQWQRDAAGAVPSRPYLQLGTSSNVTYTFDPTRAEGDRITSLRIDDEQVDPAGSYKVAVPSFLASGGDNFRAFTEGTAVDTGLLDYETWIDYLDASSPVSPSFARHAVRTEGLQETYAEGDEVSFTLPALDLTSLGSPANTSVSVSLVQGETETALGDVPVSDGAAAITATLPDGVSGEAALRIEAAPSGTAAVLPAFTIEPGEEPEEPRAEARLDVAGQRVVPQGKTLNAVVHVRGDEGRPTGEVTVTNDGTPLGSRSVGAGSGPVRVDTSALAPGEHVLTFTYGGDDTYAPVERDVTITVKRTGRP